MTAIDSNYRWNAASYAASYDNAVSAIHPYYPDVQNALLDALPFSQKHFTRVVDLGGGSGRLLQKLLKRYPNAKATLVDPSQPFLDLARQRLSDFSGRVSYELIRAQDAWDKACGPVDAIISTSALHHLDATEKNAVFRRCHEAITPGGVFLNGDEYRPPSDARYRELLDEWGDHMASQLATGAIPETFGEMIDKWRRRNLDGFGGPRQSGDDCHETVEEQTARLYGAGFSRVETVWRDRLWAVLRAIA